MRKGGERAVVGDGDGRDRGKRGKEAAVLLFQYTPLLCLEVLVDLAVT